MNKKTIYNETSNSCISFFNSLCIKMLPTTFTFYFLQKIKQICFVHAISRIHRQEGKVKHCRSR